MTDHRDRELVSYLLGTLPQDRADAFDELSVTDDAFAAQLRVAEDELIDAYIGGELTGETLAQFETAYLSSPRRRERVTFARELRRAASSKRDAPPPAMPEPIVPPPPVVTPPERPGAMAMRALVPALLVIGVFIYLLIQTVKQTPWVQAKEVVFAATTAKIGDSFLYEYLLPFELASLVLLGAMIGAVVLSRKEIKE